MQNIKFTKDQLPSLEQCFTLEWLETNGLGGYASSTILNGHTRKYHGLLVAALADSTARYVLLSNIEDIIIQNDKSHRLTAFQFPNYTEASPYAALVDFELTTHPIIRYQFERTLVTKEILMIHEENTVIIKYIINSTEPFELRIKPFLAMRYFHNLRRADQVFPIEIRNSGNQLYLHTFADLPALYFQTSHKTNFVTDINWYYQFEYYQERDRGFDCHEDLLTPGTFHFNGTGKTEFIFSCSTESQKTSLGAKFRQEQKHRQQQSGLKRSAQQFLIQPRSTSQTSIIAGYPWFEEWGRDAMVSLPGLTLIPGRKKQALAVLKHFSQYENQGVIPNFIGRNIEETAYDTADASLWFCWAVQQYLNWTKDYRNIKKYIWPTLKNIINWYQQGAFYEIKMDENGLIHAGNPSIKMTWMDGVVNQRPITARNGAAVEVNALWYNALCFIEQLARYYQDPIADSLVPLIKQVKISFCEIFWNEEKGYLYDYVNATEKNDCIRPNQIFAVSMPNSPVSAVMAKKIVEIVTQHLLTPYGLRTLSPQDPNYIGTYRGNEAQRTTAYHMGTVWPWLLGHYGEALLKTASSKKEVMEILSPCFLALQQHLSTTGLGSISEIFDGDAPHLPQGSISQAWSVAEFMRLAYLTKVKIP